jgi:farnesyl diphosphate synthase
MSDLAARMRATSEAIEAELHRLLPATEGAQAPLHAAMRYAMLGGGKRLRPFLVVAGAGLFDVPSARALRVGAAIEMIHGYSLVHDDLPAMDDAALRRGRPSCHREFDDATAILAGDALQSLAFEVLAGESTHPDPMVRCHLVRGLALAAGAAGMCGGQMIDLDAEGRALEIEEVLRLQRLKTGALIGFACEAGAILGGAPDAVLAALRGYAADLGLAFQIQDDLLDVTGDVGTTGKDQGIDAAAGKATVVGLLGIGGARDRLQVLRRSANEHLKALPGDGRLLRAVVDFVISRST